MRGQEHSPAAAGEHVQRMLQDWYYRSSGVPPGGPGPWRQLPEGILPFELKADATAPGTPTAYTAYLLGIDSSGDYNIPLQSGSPDAAFAIYVFDLAGEFSALGYTTMQAISTSLHGARGWCARSDPNADEPAGNAPAFSIVHLQQRAKLIRVAIGSSAVAGGATFTPTSLAVMDGGQDPSGGGLSYPTIKNYSTGIPASATGVICAWDGSPNQYLVIDAPCP